VQSPWLCELERQDREQGVRSWAGHSGEETAKGVIFVSLEDDETGTVQVIAWKTIKKAQRHEFLNSRLMAVHGTWQRDGELRSLVASRLEDLTPLLGRLSTVSRDFH
jgi:error-prone DNA polymerase